MSTLNLHILTIFPELFDSFLSSSLVFKASEKNLLKVSRYNIRDYASAPHYQVDDSPYGGGAGMVMKPDVLGRSIEAVKTLDPKTHVVLLSASGAAFNQKKAEELSKRDSITFVCGRYEGVDQRAIDLFVDEELSIGDYVVMGGEVPAMIIIEATVRLRPEVLGNESSLTEESFRVSAEHGQLLEGPQYTRPPEFRNQTIPEILLSGNHQKIAEWRAEQALLRTQKKRPDLLRASHDSPSGGALLQKGAKAR
jgi:tRNA (guanine37-N1)-methyltransferase